MSSDSTKAPAVLPQDSGSLPQLNWRWVLLMCTTLGLFLFLYRSLDDVARGHPVEWTSRFVEEFSGACAVFVLVWPVSGFVMRFPISGRFKTRAPLYAAAGVVFGLLATTLMYVSRLIVFYLLGRGTYDYGFLPTRYAMEMPMELIAFSVIATSLHSRKTRWLAEQQRARVDALERELAQAQLQTLQLQIQPHFLFNALNAISALIDENPRAADRMVNSLGEFLRRVLREDQAQQVALRQEIDFALLYIDIMKVRFEDRLDFHLTFNEGLEDALVPPLILQPLVENAVRYGTDSETGRAEVSIEARRVNSQVELRVRNRRHPATDRSSGTGLGLKNVENRLEKLYGTHAAVRLDAGSEFTEVTVTLPLHVPEGTAAS